MPVVDHTISEKITFGTVGAGTKQDAPKEPAKTESAAKTESSVDSKAPADKSKEQPKEKKEEAKVLKTGEKFTLKDWEVTLDSFEFNKSVKDKMFS